MKLIQKRNAVAVATTSRRKRKGNRKNRRSGHTRPTSFLAHNATRSAAGVHYECTPLVYFDTRKNLSNFQCKNVLRCESWTALSFGNFFFIIYTYIVLVHVINPPKYCFDICNSMNLLLFNINANNRISVLSYQLSSRV